MIISQQRTLFLYKYYGGGVVCRVCIFPLVSVMKSMMLECTEEWIGKVCEIYCENSENKMLCERNVGCNNNVQPTHIVTFFSAVLGNTWQAPTLLVPEYQVPQCFVYGGSSYVGRILVVGWPQYIAVAFAVGPQSRAYILDTRSIGPGPTYGIQGPIVCILYACVGPSQPLPVPVVPGTYQVPGTIYYGLLVQVLCSQPYVAGTVHWYVLQVKILRGKNVCNVL